MPAVTGKVKTERIKTCFKCGQQKELSDFYAHKMMADGHLNKCKDCAKADSIKREEEKRRDPEWMAAERERCREKQARYREAGTAEKPSRAAKDKWRKTNPAKVRAQKMARRAKREASKRQKERRRMVYSTPANMKTGETVSFPTTKTRYQRQADGSLRRV